MEDHRSPAQRRRGDYAGRIQSAGANVLLELLEVDPLAQRSAERIRVKQRSQPGARDAEHLACVLSQPREGPSGDQARATSLQVIDSQIARASAIS